MGAQEFPGERELEPRASEGSFLERLADELAGSVCSVFGSPVERDGVTVIPVAKARWGMGGGAKSRGEVRPPGSVGGGGAIVKPMGFLELSGGRTKFRPILDPSLIAGTAIATGMLGLAALQTIVGVGRPSTRARLRVGRRRIERQLRRIFR
jgi:uncharacterized spore protein YtfJ